MELEALTVDRDLTAANAPELAQPQLLVASLRLQL